MSSLQQALGNAANRLKLKKLGDNGCNSDNKQNKSGGAFENSFAQGLDMSEILYDDAPNNQRTSASDELLKIREGERRQRQIQEEEEAKMEEALQKRLNCLKEQTVLKNKAKEEQRKQQSVFEIGDALLRMHGTDERATDRLSQKANISRKGAVRRNSASRRTSHSANNNNNKSNNKSYPAKKSRKAKF